MKSSWVRSMVSRSFELVSVEDAITLMQLSTGHDEKMKIVHDGMVII